MDIKRLKEIISELSDMDRNLIKEPFTKEVHNEIAEAFGVSIGGLESIVDFLDRKVISD